MDLPINQIICGDCLEVMRDWPDNCVDLVLTDPPYPDYHKEKYKYYAGILDVLTLFDCVQLIFWTAKVRFPLSYSSIHIWDKSIDCASYYERIFERNGGLSYKIYRQHPPIFTDIPSGQRDVNMGHPSQKPLPLLKKLILQYSKKQFLILDPFCGSGTTCVAAKMLGRDYIGIDISEEYCQIARDRIKAVETGVPVKEARAGQKGLWE
jgi:site-specific DNA-methyltransferase (adenine-specific)